MELRDRITEIVRAEGGKPVRRRAIISRLRIGRSEHAVARAALKELVRTGKLIHLKGGFYTLPRRQELVTGVLRAHPQGFGFVKPADSSLEDIYVHRENMSTALDGDTVAVHCLPPSPSKREKGPEGVIIEIVRRRTSQIVGTLRKSGHFHYVLPDNAAIFQDVLIPDEVLGKARLGDKVIARITAWESKHLNPEGAVVKVLGPSGNIKTDIASVIVRFGLPGGFPKAVGTEVRKLRAAIAPDEIARRRDFRDAPVFTIDPKTAKDFDDAVDLHRDAGGNWVLGVHIADVAHYVAEGGALDAEAADRGTSCYLLNTVIPMLPPKLSNNLCSLRPNTDRLTRSVIMTFSDEGTLQRYDVCRSVINSKRRFTYEEVQEILDGKRKSRFASTLREMAALAGVLRRRRRERGAIDFDVPEPKPLIGASGEVEAFDIERRDDSHSLIEEFMLAANETVARHLTTKQRPTIFRIHEEPDEAKLAEFAEIAHHFGHDIPPAPSPHDIQHVLDQASGAPEAYVLGVAYLRSMKLAKYSADNVGHYGLASDAYLHFTSPIRRYPDLVVHRALDTPPPRGAKARTELLDALETTAKHSSERERAADEAETELRTIATYRYLDTLARQKRPPVLDGIVRDVKSFGLIVSLTDYLIEGVVRVTSLVDDYYRFDRPARRLVGRRRRKVFRAGISLKVRLRRVDLFSRSIELQIV
ncbi:MAG: ribonuclease R [Verrucomicrobia bacterium]|nr:ribonuclease R [Verrucomicrobiota bacterium]